MFTPPSPRSKALLAAWTTLYDADEEIIFSTQWKPDQGNSQHLHPRRTTPDDQATSQPQYDDRHCARSLRTRTSETPPYRVSKATGESFDPPAFACFLSSTLEPAGPPKRSAFNRQRKIEVARVRRLGACLRCQLRKISVSSTDENDRTLVSI